MTKGPQTWYAIMFWGKLQVGVWGQTPGWSLKIETHEILACSNVHVALKIALPFSFPLAGERLTGKEF